MRSTLLWGLVPDEAIPAPIFTAVVLSILVGRRVLGFRVPLLPFSLFAPFLEELVASLP